MREMANLEIAERLKKSGKTNVANIQDLLEPYLFPYFFQHLNVTIISPFDAFGAGRHKFQRGRKLDKFLGQITVSTIYVGNVVCKIRPLSRSLIRRITHKL